MMVSNIIGLVISPISFLYTFHVLYNFMYFTSTHNDHQKPSMQSSPEDSPYLIILWKLMTNTSLLSLFVLQHSFMSTKILKNLYERFSIAELDRSIYNIFSAAALDLTMKYWQFIPSISLWNIDTSASNKLWLLFTGFHLLGWFIIYSGCVMLDISELTGLKQVYYKISNRPCPMSTKSKEYQRYLLHMRHPSFTAFLMILWMHPFMTIDRLLMSSIFTIYMLLMWRIDEIDYCYHATNVNRKCRELS